MNKFYCVILLVFSTYFISDAQSECDECYNALFVLNDSLDSKVNIIDEYKEVLVQKESELRVLKGIIFKHGIDTTGYGFPISYPYDSTRLYTQDSMGQNLNPTQMEADSLLKIEFELKNQELKIELENLQDDLISKNYKIIELQDSIVSLMEENSNLMDSLQILRIQIVALNSEIESLKKKIEKLKEDILELKSIIDCVNKFANEQLLLRDSAEVYLSKARDSYTEIYPLSKRKGKGDIVIEKINEVVSIYNKYQTTNEKMECSTIKPLEYSQDNLKAKDDFYLMRIYAFNEGNVVDSLNSWSDEKNGRQKSVGLALKHLGNLMQKGNYDDKNLPKDIIKELIDIIKNLGFYIIPSKTDNSDRIALKKVIEYYNKGQYDSALSQYNKYERYIDAENTGLSQSIVHDIKFKIASIIIWQLTPISRDKSIYPESSWLNKISGDPMTEGKRMIQDLLNIIDLDFDIKKNCIITKAKIYERA